MFRGPYNCMHINLATPEKPIIPLEYGENRGWLILNKDLSNLLLIVLKKNGLYKMLNNLSFK